MSLTLLLDLDDTLLVNNIDEFLPAYLQAISTELASYAQPQVLISTLLSATRQMMSNTRPDCTLKEVFDQAFYPALGHTAEELEPTLEHFYGEVFPRLQSLTKTRPNAVKLVETAMSRGYRVVIATNPAFPRSAIEHRLAWAGLPVDRYAFDLVSSYESFHFAKPNPAYFAEVLARLGWPDGPVVMVGDDLKNDIIPCRQLGLPVYWIANPNLTAPTGQNAPTGSGRLGDFLPWLDSMPHKSLQPDYSSITAMCATLRATPAALRSLSEGLEQAGQALWSRRPNADEWAPNEILAHLRDVELEVNLPRLHSILNQENPFLAGKDTDPWAEERVYIQQNGPQALQRFIAARMKSMDLLDHLPPEAWERTARHAIFGPTRLSELVGISAAHDRLHLRQFLRTIKTLQATI